MPEQLFMDSFPVAQPITRQKVQPVGKNNEGFKKTASEPTSEQASEPGSEQAFEAASQQASESASLPALETIASESSITTEQVKLFGKNSNSDCILYFSPCNF